MIEVNDRFREFTKKAKYKVFKEETELGHHDLKTEVKYLIRDFEEFKKSVSTEILIAVKK